jgi:hypothetical protein
MTIVLFGLVGLLPASRIRFLASAAQLPNFRPPRRGSLSLSLRNVTLARMTRASQATGHLAAHHHQGTTGSRDADDDLTANHWRSEQREYRFANMDWLTHI